jgi:hypothetical protein
MSSLASPGSVERSAAVTDPGLVGVAAPTEARCLDGEHRGDPAVDRVAVACGADLDLAVGLSCQEAGPGNVAAPVRSSPPVSCGGDTCRWGCRARCMTVPADSLITELSEFRIRR